MELSEKEQFIKSFIQFRKSRHLTQPQLSARSGVPQPVIARLEKGTTDPKLTTILRLLDSMGAKLIIKEDQKMDYFNTLEIEVMTEVAASIEATISRFVIAKNIQDDEKHPLNILESMIFDLKHSLVCKDYTMEELNLIKAKFEFAREYANEVIKNNE
ncbi:helix-turn-helix domain-containing protein [Ruminococcus sp.]|uniref:helix-turn-helix domain-containing protein n=1 Tax=Ruminococcus sp. TaxID=41978 RepID=UPI0025EAC221|nr:helix-turn-helix domain-containing protein [Ruminococcus sp.]MBQ6252456.1 helix-turn-helix domain-containing protein [Ruminococcus sp.]